MYTDEHFELHGKGTFNSFNGLNTGVLPVGTGYELSIGSMVPLLFRRQKCLRLKTTVKGRELNV